MKVTFYIDRKNTTRKGEAPIFLSASYEGKRIILATKEKVRPENWIVKDGRVKEPKIIDEVTESDLRPMRINNLLSALEARVKNIYSHERERMLNEEGRFSEIPTSFIKDKLKAPKPVDVFKLIDLFLEYKKPDVSTGTYAQYRTWKSAMKRYNDKGEKLTLSSFDNGFYVKYRKFYKNLEEGYIKLHNSKTRGFLEWTKTGDRLNLKTKNPKDNLVYLTWTELKKIHGLDLSDHEMTLARDILIFNCFVPHRFEDVIGIEKRNILKHDDGTRYVRFWEQKKSKWHIVDLITITEQIVQKYENASGENLFPKIKLHGYNQNLKKLGKLAGLDNMVSFVKNGQHGEAPKYERMSSKIGRKTFTTLAQNSGMSLQATAAVTDHDSRAIEAYYEITQDTQREAMKQMDSFTFNAPEAEI